MRTSVLVGAVLVAATAIGCSSSSTPAGPSVSTAGGGGGGNYSTSQIFVLGGGSGDAFRPSPATIPTGAAIVFVNSDELSHQIAATDGSFDTGIIERDQQSAPITLTTDGAHYYCTIHTGEVGVIRAADGTVPPCTGPHC